MEYITLLAWNAVDKLGPNSPKERTTLCLGGTLLSQHTLTHEGKRSSQSIQCRSFLAQSWGSETGPGTFLAGMVHMIPGTVCLRLHDNNPQACARSVHLFNGRLCDVKRKCLHLL